jgi:hypothetical protein
MYISNAEHTKPPYSPGVKRWSLYRSLWLKYSKPFLSGYINHFQSRFGVLTDEKIDEVKKLIECGEFGNGFVVHSCLHCGTKLVIPFTCKSRLCLSCRRKNLFGWSVQLSELMYTSFNHVHVTFTIPGRVHKMIQNSGFDETDLITLSAGVYVRLMRMSKYTDQKHLMPGMLATLHKCGNSLNYNPHVHLVGTTDMVHRQTGEILKTGFIHYAKARHLWMHAVCALLVKQNIITTEIAQIIKDAYPDGFHVYFAHIDGDNNEILGRTAEYIASGFFHNSQITEIDHRKKTVTFRYKKHVNRISGEKLYDEKTLNIFEFMARMLYFLPEKHSKQIRWYGLYANGIREKLQKIERKTWAIAVRHSYEKNPEICPKCNIAMVRMTIFSFYAVREAKKLWRTHACVNGYFIPYKNDP